mmetsp:Transcript_10965/g.32467  ORF Transcript_10965/g.32467 Transcript_10965/m.32467 type:complete len:112 (-) Transcript_10965:343-678(-)
MKFREEYRRERRLRSAGRWESDDSSSSSDDDGELRFPTQGAPIATAGAASEGGIEPSIACIETNRGENAHKVSESSSSNDEQEQVSDESTASSQSNVDDISRVGRRKTQQT